MTKIYNGKYQEVCVHVYLACLKGALEIRYEGTRTTKVGEIIVHCATLTLE